MRPDDEEVEYEEVFRMLITSVLFRRKLVLFALFVFYSACFLQMLN